MKFFALITLILTSNVLAEDLDIHPRCPFKNYKNVDQKSLCFEYDNEMGECDGESQLECSNQAFEKVLSKNNIKAQEVNFEENIVEIKKEKVIPPDYLKGCSFNEDETQIKCVDGRIYKIDTRVINNIPRDVLKEMDKKNKARGRNRQPTDVLKK